MLDNSDYPEISDVIIVPEGLYLRSEKAVDLLLKKYSNYNKIIVSPSFSERYGSILSLYYNHGAKPENIICEDASTSTWTNAINTINIMNLEGYKSAIVVTSDFHIRRTKLAFKRAAKGMGLKFYFVASYKSIDGVNKKYFEVPRLCIWAFNELWKYTGYLLHLYNWIDL